MPFTICLELYFFKSKPVLTRKRADKKPGQEEKLWAWRAGLRAGSATSYLRGQTGPLQLWASVSPSVK